MAVARKQLIEVFIRQCNAREEIVTGYRDELLNTVTDIILKEAEHLEKKMNIQQEVDELCDRLGNWIINNSSN